MRVISKNQEQFQDIGEILLRHRNLKSSLQRLWNEEKRVDVGLQRLKIDYSNYLKSKSNQILLLNLEIGGFENQLEVILIRFWKPKNENLTRRLRTTY